MEQKQNNKAFLNSDPGNQSKEETQWDTQLSLLKTKKPPWPGDSALWSAVLYTERSLVQSPVQAHT